MVLRYTVRPATDKPPIVTVFNSSAVPLPFLDSTLLEKIKKQEGAKVGAGTSASQ
jgi:hypothetical protein